MDRCNAAPSRNVGDETVFIHQRTVAVTAGVIDVRDDHEVGMCECGRELFVEGKGAVVRMRLVDTDDPPVGVRTAQSLECRADLHRMVPVVVNDGDTIEDLAPHLHSSPGSCIGLQGLRRLFHGKAKDGGEREDALGILLHVTPGNTKRHEREPIGIDHGDSAAFHDRSAVRIRKVRDDLSMIGKFLKKGDEGIMILREGTVRVEMIPVARRENDNLR